MNTLRNVISCAFAAAMLMAAPVTAAQTTDSVCMKQLPWESSFEPDVDSLQCWTVLHQHTTYPTVYHGYASSGWYSLAMTSPDMQTPCMIATPRLAHRADSLHIGFNLTMVSGSGTLEVGLMTDSTFVTQLTLPLDENARLGFYEFYTDNFPSTDSLKVAFKVTNCRVCIDDVSVEAASTCRRPCSAWVDEVSIYGISIGWDHCGGIATSFIVRQIDTATNDTLYTSVYDSPATLMAMNAGTTYDMAIAAGCNGDTTDWFHVGLVTTEVACRQPVEAEVAALTATAAGLRWNYDNAAINAATGMIVELTDMYTDSNTLTYSTPNQYIFADNLSTGHTYQATLQTICSTDTSSPITLTFMPLADPCSESEGSSNSLVFPVAVSSPYSYSQTLYPASLLTGMDSLHALAFRIVGEPILYYARTLDVYIGQIDDSTLLNNISTLNAQRVVNGGSFAPSGAGWTTLEFDHPIAVNPQRNLLITIVDHTGMIGGQLRFGTRYGTIGGTLHGTSTEMPLNPTEQLLSLTSSTAVADIQLFGNCSIACVPPAAMVIGSSPTTLTVGWTGATGTCMVLYREAGGTGAPLAAMQTAPGRCVLQGLNPGTRYWLRVSDECGESTEFEGNTQCGIVSVPYYTDFTIGANPCWQGNQTINQGIFDNGVRLSGILISPEVGQAANTLQLRLAPVGTGQIYVGVCDADGENMQWIDTAEIDEVYDNWTVYLNGYTGTSRRIAIAGSSAAAVLRSITIEQLDDCLPPQNVTVSGVNGTGATLSWQGTAGHYEGFLFEEGTGHQTHWEVDDNHVTFSGLTGNTMYHGHMFKSCGEDFSMPVTFSFTTECENITYFPYYQSFESVMAPAECWHVSYADATNASLNPVIHTTEQVYDGHRSLRFSSYNYIPSSVYNQYIISPRIVADDSIWLSFRYRKDNMEQEPFAVGFSTSSNNVQDFLWFGTEQAVAGQWLEYRVGLPSVTRYVAIHYMGQNSYYLYIDDLRITGPGCDAPMITMVDEQTNSISIGWTASGDTSFVAITEGNEIWTSDIEGIPTVTNDHTFSGLEDGHIYTIGVRSRCPDGHLTDWTTRQVMTINLGCTPPNGLIANNVSYTTADIEWQPTIAAQQWQVCLLADGVLHTLFQPVATTHFTLDGLEQGVEYNVLVRSLCGECPGPWSDTLTFSTLECATVSEPTFERVNFRTINLSWQEAPVSSGLHRVEYGRQGFTLGSGTVVESTDMPLTIGNLEPEWDYDFYISNYCQPGVMSGEAALLNVPASLGIDEIESSRNLGIFPNPATTTATIGLAGFDGEVNIEVLDIRGRIVDNHDITTGSASTVNFQLSTINLAPGTYFVRVTDATRAAVGKFTVSR